MFKMVSEPQSERGFTVRSKFSFVSRPATGADRNLWVPDERRGADPSRTIATP
jgi:hypothetical protein